jgi:hypothetical protein
MCKPLPAMLTTDIRTYIEEFVDKEARDLKKYPNQIYQALLQELHREFPSKVVKIPSRKSLYDKIRHARGTTVAKSVAIETVPYCATLDGTTFLRRSWYGDIGGVYHRFALWASDEALAILRMDSQIFVDATFRVTPSPFSQCLIVMSHDPSTFLYVPCVWALMTSKDEYLYCSVLHEIIVLLKYRWEPKIIVIDFERALLNTIKYQFPAAHIIGCFFHFRQAIHRKMKKLGISDDAASTCMGLMGRFMEVSDQALDGQIHEMESHPQLCSSSWKVFWAYFRDTWMKRFPPALWRVNTKEDEVLAGRTNNCLERYNRRLGDKFLNSHPNIFSFIDAIKEEEQYYAHLSRGIRAGAIPLKLPADAFVMDHQ